MTATITLITPPDIYQNDRTSILFIDLTEDEQDKISKWLGQNGSELLLNIYYYQGETNVPWLLHALSCSNFKYINVNNMSATTSYLAGYILSKSDVFYYTTDENVASLYSHINLNRVKDTDQFLETLFGGKESYT
jgi:hypothetical protein